MVKTPEDVVVEIVTTFNVWPVAWPHQVKTAAAIIAADRVAAVDVALAKVQAECERREVEWWNPRRSQHDQVCVDVSSDLRDWIAALRKGATL